MVSAKMKNQTHLVLFDGECGFCRRSLGWLRRHLLAGHKLEFAPSQAADLSPALRAACANALHVVKSDGQILRAGKAALFCLESTRWHRCARLLARPPFIGAVEMVYGLVAANRIRISKLLFVKETDDKGDEVRSHAPL